MTAWIDGDGQTVGTLGFLVEIGHLDRGGARHELRDRPPTTNMSHEPKPVGWCGDTNNVRVDGRGVWRVVRAAKNGRVQVERVMDREILAAWLDEVGYPDLLDECCE